MRYPHSNLWEALMFAKCLQIYLVAGPDKGWIHGKFHPVTAVRWLNATYGKEQENVSDFGNTGLKLDGDLLQYPLF